VKSDGTVIAGLPQFEAIRGSSHLFQELTKRTYINTESDVI